MPPKGKKTKAEEALAFLENLDSLDVNDPSSTPAPPSGGAAAAGGNSAAASGAEAPAANPALASIASSSPRASTDSTRRPAPADLSGSTGDLPRSSTESKSGGAAAAAVAGAGAAASGAGASAGAAPGGDGQDPEEALAFLQAQINQKRAPLSVPSQTPRTTSPAPPASSGSAASGSASTSAVPPEAANVPTAAAGGWGVSSFWSTATSALQSAQKIADEGYKRVKTEGVGGLEQLAAQRGMNLNELRKGAEERLGGLQGMVKGVDLEKLRQDLLSNASTTLTTLINTVAPPISAHETLELWLSHPMSGYGGVEGVVYRAWMKILEQTESGEMIVVWSPPSEDKAAQARSINHVDGWEEGWRIAKEGVEGVRGREEKNPRGRKAQENPNMPVTTVPIFLHLQPIVAPLPFPEPSVLLSASEDPSPPLKHLYFILTLQDPGHSLRFSTVSQPSPADWLEVEYEKSDWVEERLVEVLRTSVEVVAQDYVATRMGLKPSITRPASPADSKKGEGKAEVKAD